MYNQRKINSKLTKHIKAIEKTKGDYISQVLYANFKDKQHSMLIEDEKAFVLDETVYKELLPLEKVDLIDYWKREENGRTNKKRRNLLRRS